MCRGLLKLKGANFYRWAQDNCKSSSTRPSITTYLYGRIQAFLERPHTPKAKLMRTGQNEDTNLTRVFPESKYVLPARYSRLS